MERINLVQSKGGQGTSVTACAVALVAARHGRQVAVDGHDVDALAAIFGMHGRGAVSPGLTVGQVDGDVDLLVHDGPGDDGASLLVVRPCYLALRRAVGLGLHCDGLVLVAEPGRALRAQDVAGVIGRPVVATIPLSPAVARAVDAGVLAARLPDELAAAATQILEFTGEDFRREVA